MTFPLPNDELPFAEGERLPAGAGQDVAALLLVVAPLPAHMPLLAADLAATSRFAHACTSMNPVT
jgi:hypothetical protein